MGLRIHHLDCGTMDPKPRSFVHGPGARHDHLVCHCLVIETSEGLVLIDSGIGRQDIAHPRRRLGSWFLNAIRPCLDDSITAITQLEAMGFSADDVRNIVLTHLDLDHAGGLSDFPKARVHVSRTEYDRAQARPTAADRSRYRPEQWAHDPSWSRYDTDGEPWHGFECVRNLEGLPPEILLVPIIGHSAGHSAVAVQTDGGWLLHAGDAYFHHGELDLEHLYCPPGLRFFQWAAAWDRQKRLENRARLRELKAGTGGAVEIFSAHDPVELERSLRSASAAPS